MNEQIVEMCREGWCRSGQNMGHMPRIYQICMKLKPRIIVETGVGAPEHGASTYTFLIIAKELDAQLYSIDIEPRNEWFQKRFPQLDYSHWHFLRSDSVAMLEGLPDEAKPIDFLHLDSDHSYEHVTGELNAAQPYLAKKHVIASHDTEESQPDCRRAMHRWAAVRGYVVRQFEDWHGETFLTPLECATKLFGDLT